MRNRHLSKLTGNTAYIYLFALDYTNIMEMKELDERAKLKKPLLKIWNALLVGAYNRICLCQADSVFSRVHWIYITVMQ